ncbi:DUF1702 family protein [Nonomuraea sp. NBC_01738]|uniref:DUF1702 family protein n=1 Tax=Nonomuraea sp. NBC_01738 TaxID=2976003 RepID=UPI002E108278|nr:DUF1702 family protein [Nonomuraea sp. NBC_01738]
MEPTLTPVRGLWRFLEKDPRESDLGRRRFHLRPGHARDVLESAERAYVFGFNAAISREIAKIGEIPLERRPFAYEGAGAASAALDLITLTRGRRLHELLAGPAKFYEHAVHLGVGRAYALLRLRPMRGLRHTHPLLRWLAVDGFGFQQGLTRTDRMVGEHAMPDLVTRTHCAIFDQGLGRLLWYHDCASPDQVAARVSSFPTGRRADLWSGVGFAATYTGGADADALAALTSHAGADGFRSHLVQGCAFATSAWLATGALPAHVTEAVAVLTDATPDEAVAWTDTALIALGHDPHTHEDFLDWAAHTRHTWSRRHR